MIFMFINLYKNVIFGLKQKAIIDYWATLSLMRENLSNLDSHMATMKSDIEEFNRFVNLSYQDPQASSESYDNIMVHILKACQVASDCEFVSLVND